MSKFYVYEYRHDELHDLAGTVFYVGKGSGKRAYRNHDNVEIPKDIKNIFIIETNMTESDAFKLEIDLIAKYGRLDKGTGILVNKTYGGDGNSGRVTVKDNLGNISSVFVDDPKYISGELVHFRKGMTVAKNSLGITFSISKSDLENSSDDIQHMAKGLVTVKDRDGNTSKVSINDPRYISGELAPIAKGQVRVRNTDNTVSIIAKEEFDAGGYKGSNVGKIVVRNKITKETLCVSVDDPRFISGELESVCKFVNIDRVTVKDRDGNTSKVSINDPQYISGELVCVTSGMINAYNPISGETVYMKTTDIRYLSGEYIHQSKGRKDYIHHQTGKVKRLLPTDQKIISGEYILKRTLK